MSNSAMFNSIIIDFINEKIIFCDYDIKINLVENGYEIIDLIAPVHVDKASVLLFEYPGFQVCFFVKNLFRKVAWLKKLNLIHIDRSYSVELTSCNVQHLAEVLHFVDEVKLLVNLDDLQDLTNIKFFLLLASLKKCSLFLNVPAYYSESKFFDFVNKLSDLNIDIPISIGLQDVENDISLFIKCKKIMKNNFKSINLVDYRGVIC